MSEELEGLIVDYDAMDQLGTIELQDGRKVRFGLTACPATFRPHAGARVLVSDVVEGFRGALKAKAVREREGIPAPALIPVLQRLDGDVIPVSYPAQAALSAPEVWSKLEEWLSGNVAALSAGFAPGASSEKLAALSAELGQPIPQELEAILRVHDGALFVPYPPRPGTFTMFQIFQNIDLLGCDAMRNERRLGASWPAGAADELEVTGPIKRLGWSEGWLPFALLYGSTHYLCVDLDPAAGGTSGQVIEVGLKSGERRVVCASVQCFFEGLLNSLSNREVRVVQVRAY